MADATMRVPIPGLTCTAKDGPTTDIVETTRLAGVDCHRHIGLDKWCDAALLPKHTGDDLSDLIVGVVACGNSEPIGPGENIVLQDLTPEAAAVLRAAMDYDGTHKTLALLTQAAKDFASTASRTTIECPSCEGSGETPVQDHWSYGDGRGRGEGHYTTGGGPCPCCKGDGRVPADSGHEAGDDCGQPPEPPEPEPEETPHERYGFDYPHELED